MNWKNEQNTSNSAWLIGCQGLRFDASLLVQLALRLTKKNLTAEVKIREICITSWNLIEC